MNIVKTWFQALRAHFLTATVAPMLIGTAAAWYTTSRFDIGNFLLALLGALLVHLGANMGNDYFDYLSETDSLNVGANQYSGGSGVITRGLIPARHILAATLTCFVGGSLVGIYLAWKLQSIPILVLGVLGVFSAYFYTATPLRLGYRGLAELLNGLAFGPFIAMGAYLVQSAPWSATGVLASVPSGILLASLLMINEFPDFESDKAVGKRTIVVRMGKRRALAVYHASMASSFVWVGVFVAAGFFPPWSLLCALSFPLALNAYRISRAHYDDGARMVRANMSTFFLHISFCLLFALGFALPGGGGPA